MKYTLDYNTKEYGLDFDANEYDFNSIAKNFKAKKYQLDFSLRFLWVKTYHECSTLTTSGGKPRVRSFGTPFCVFTANMNGNTRIQRRSVLNFIEISPLTSDQSSSRVRERHEYYTNTYYDLSSSNF